MKKAIYTILGIYTLACLALFCLQRHLLYFPDQSAFEDCKLNTAIHGTKSSSQSSQNEWRYYKLAENAHPTQLVIFFHGNAGRACDRDYLAKELVDAKTELWLFEYPGFSETDHKKNDPSEERILISVKALVDEVVLKEKFAKIYFMGESLGTGVATYASTLIKNSGLILFSPYTSIANVAQSHYPVFPVKLLVIDKFNAADWAANTQSEKALLFHSKKDNVIPFEIGEAQSKNLSIPSDFIPNTDRNHNDLLLDNPDLWNQVREFL